MKRIFFITALLTGLFAYPRISAAQEIGHYAPGVMGIRDFTVPDSSGFYGLLYTYGYFSNRLNDSEGNELDLVTIRPGATVDVDVNVDAYVLAPTFVWVSRFKFLRARYAAYVSLAFGNTSVGASLSSSTGSGRSAKESQFGLADLYVQPVWLGWGKKHWDFALAYGFYAPVGKYDVETVTLPVVGEFSVEAADNIGLGFWTNQLQGVASYYPWADKRMSIATAVTYEINSNKRDFDIKPGQNLSLNWGISQYIPVTKSQTLLLEVGPAGYSSWQVTDDKGSDAADSPVKDNVHGVGGQIGLTYVKWNAVLNFHYFYEFAAKDRFQGQSIGLNFAIKLCSCKKSSKKQ